MATAQGDAHISNTAFDGVHQPGDPKRSYIYTTQGWVIVIGLLAATSDFSDGSPTNPTKGIRNNPPDNRVIIGHTVVAN